MNILYNKFKNFRFFYEWLLFMVKYQKRTLGTSSHSLEKYFSFEARIRNNHGIWFYWTMAYF